MYANLKLAPHLAAVFSKSMWFSDVNMIVVSFIFILLKQFLHTFTAIRFAIQSRDCKLLITCLWLIGKSKTPYQIIMEVLVLLKYIKHPTVSKKSMKNLPFITTYHTYDVSCQRRSLYLVRVGGGIGVRLEGDEGSLCTRPPHQTLSPYNVGIRQVGSGNSLGDRTIILHLKQLISLEVS